MIEDFLVVAEAIKIRTNYHPTGRRSNGRIIVSPEGQLSASGVACQRTA